MCTLSALVISSLDSLLKIAKSHAKLVSSIYALYSENISTEDREISLLQIRDSGEADRTTDNTIAEKNSKLVTQ